MLVGVSSHLLVMSIVAGGLVLFLKLSDALGQKSFPATWRYYTHLIGYSFFLVPYPTIVALLRFPLRQAVPLGQYDAMLPCSQITLLAHWSRHATPLILPLSYILVVGAVIFMATILLEKRRIRSRILAACHTVSDDVILSVLDECRLKLNIKKAIPVYVASYSTTPFLHGCVRPFVVLPNHDFSRSELKYIFLHELTHLKRHDMWIKGLLLLINAFHWYNPLAYLSRQRIYYLCELSCDESITRTMTHTERQKYCEMILDLLLAARGQSRAASSLIALSNGRQHLEERINRIMEGGYLMRHRTFTAGIAVTLLIGFIGVIAAYAASENLIQLNKFQPITTYLAPLYDDKSSFSSTADAEQLDRLNQLRKTDITFGELITDVFPEALRHIPSEALEFLNTTKIVWPNP